MCFAFLAFLLLFAVVKNIQCEFVAFPFFLGHCFEQDYQRFYTLFVVIMPTTLNHFNGFIFYAVNQTMFFINAPAPKPDKSPFSSSDLPTPSWALRCISLSSMFMCLSVFLSCICQLRYCSHAFSSKKS